MNHSRLRLTFALAALMLLPGCAGKVKYPKYYTLNLPAPPDPPLQEGAHASIAVREFRSPGYLHTGAIVYRRSAEEIGFYDYHRWATDPRDFLSNTVADRLRASGRFAQVKPYDGHADVDYVLTGYLDKLEEIDYQDGVQVEVAISAQLSSLSTGETVWTNSVQETGKVQQRDVPSVVSAMSRTMNQAIGKLLAQVPNSVPRRAN